MRRADHRSGAVLVRPAQSPPAQVRIPGVIQWLEEPGTIHWKPVRYNDSPPIIGDVSYDGERIGYPIELTTLNDYAGLINQLIYAYERRGVWIIEPMCTKKGGVFSVFKDADNFEVLNGDRSGILAEVDPETLAIHSDRQVFTPAFNPGGVAVGENYLYCTDRVNSQMYEYRVDTMARERSFKLGDTQSFFDPIPGVTVVPYSVGGNDDVLYIVGRDTSEVFRLWTIDIVGPNRTLTLSGTPKKLSEIGPITSVNYSTGVGGDANVIWLSTKNGTYYKLDPSTYAILRQRNDGDGRTPTGFGGDSARCFSTVQDLRQSTDPSPKTGYVQERDVNTLAVIRERPVSFFSPMGIG